MTVVLDCPVQRHPKVFADSMHEPEENILASQLTLAALKIHNVQKNIGKFPVIP